MFVCIKDEHSSLQNTSAFEKHFHKLKFAALDTLFILDTNWKDNVIVSY